MDRRPPAIEIRSHSLGPLAGAPDAFSRPLPSPRLHIAGEVPPDLSPLDAFAAQSRMLARRLEEGAKEGRRLSRLPPLSLEDSLVAPRPSYLRSASAQEPIIQPEPPRSPAFAMKMEVQASSDRPMSVHPRMSKVPNPGAGPRLGTSANSEGRASEDSDRGRTSFDTRSLMGNQREEALRRARQVPAIQTNSNNSPRFSNYTQDYPLPRIRDGRGLAPPRSPSAQTSSTFVPRFSMDDGQHDGTHSADPGLRPSLRKFSSSSVLSTTSPISPSMFSLPRSPSACSDISTVNGLQRPTFNFSRPLSRAEPPPRQSSGDSDQLVLTDDSGLTPGLDPVGSFDSNHDGSSSYVYSKFNLPRGKTVQRSPTPMDSNLNFFGDDHIIGEGEASTAPPSPPYHQSPKQIAADAAPLSSPLPLSLTIGHPPQPAQSGLLAANNQPEEEERSAEWHLTKGIDCHEAGSLNESTYHLRIAAREGSATGMILYALACRHGWGMRRNEAEGVKWLNKAVNLAQHEVADDEEHLKAGQARDIIAQRERKAQFALSVYELGVSHLNGWGIEQNKPMALRCFEIAGSWGDRDALAEAGFCYAQGVGTKKDMKKAARFYREAESKGVSMVGQSWYDETLRDEIPIQC